MKLTFFGKRYEAGSETHPSPWFVFAILAFLWLRPVWSVAGAPSEGAQSAFRDFDEVSIDNFLNVTVTTATRHEQSLAEAPNSVTVVTAEEIRAFGYETLADVLRNLAGMYVSNDRNYEYLGVRGFAPPGDYNTRILLLVDGHSTNDIAWNYAGLGTDQPLDLSVVDRIEVLRGPGSALYGTNAIFGTINVISKKPADLGGLEITAGRGSFQNWHGSAALATKAGAPISGILSISVMGMEGPDLYYPEFSSNQGGGWIRGLDGDHYRRFFATVSRGAVSVRSLYASRTKGIPTAPWGGIVGDPASESTDALGFLEASIDHPVRDDLGFFARVYGHSCLYKAGWPYDSEDSTGVGVRQVDREQQDGLSGGAESRLDWRPHSRHRILAGAESRWDEFNMSYINTWPSLGQRNTAVDQRRLSALQSAYAQDECVISSRLTSTIGGHYDHYSAFGTKFTPRLGLVFAAARGTRLKVLYGEGFKAPSNGEFVYYDEDIQINNPDLAPERYRTGEIIAERFWGSNCWTHLSAHFGQVDDLIRLNQVGTDGPLQYQNTGRAKLRGLELEAKASLPEGIVARGSLTRQEVRTLDPDEWAPNSPRWLAGVGLHRWMLAGRGAVGFEMRYVGERRGVREEVRVAGYTTADLNILLPLPLPGLQAALKIKNLTDRRFYDPGGEEHVMPSIQQDGRTWWLSLTHTLRPREGNRP